VSNPLLDAALDYARRGYPVFPLKKDKKPLTEHGFKDATTDLEQVASWWRKWPYANIGIRTGVLFDVVDVEAENLGRFEALCDQEDIDLDLYPTVKSGGGGFHYYVAVTGRNGPLEGIGDLKGQGGYVLAPPSQLSHTKGGGRYEWVASGSGEFPQCPTWILGQLGHSARTPSRFAVIFKGQRIESEDQSNEVTSEHRYTVEDPCEICEGHKNGRHGPGADAGMHCWGFRSGQYAICTRVEHAGGLELNPKTLGYHHRLTGSCGCGVDHREPSETANLTIYKPCHRDRTFWS